MKIALSVVLLLVVAGCSGHAHVASSCVHLARAEGPSERTGEHTVIIQASGCGVRAVPSFQLLDDRGHALPFRYDVRVGRPNGRVDFDKYRCDIHTQATVATVRLTFGGHTASLAIPNDSLLDYCPAEVPSRTIHVLVGAPLTSWRGVFRDVYDGKLDRYWSCDALQTALAHFPVDGPMYSKAPAILKSAPC